MKLKINFDNGTTRYTQNVSKRKFSAILTKLEPQDEDMSGSASVEYSRGFWNKFDFSNLTELRQKMEPCLERSLLDEFKMDKKG